MYFDISMTSSLACFTKYAQTIIDNGDQAEVVYINVSKAFGKIQHDIIFARLRLLGILNQFSTIQKTPCHLGQFQA